MEEKLKSLVMLTRRSLAQTKELLVLCSNDFDKLFKMEASIKQNFEYGCPTDVEEVERLVNLWKS